LVSKRLSKSKRMGMWIAMDSEKSQERKTSSLTTWKTYKRLLKAARPYWVAFAIGIIGTVLAIAVDSAFAWSVKPFVDKGLVAREQWLLHWLPFIIVGGCLLRGGTYFLSNYYIARVGRSVVMDFRKLVFNHIMHLPSYFHDKRSSGKLLSLIIYNTEQIAYASTDALLVVLQEGLTLVGLLVVMFIISWPLTLMFMVTAPFVSLVVRFNSKRLRMLSANVQKTVGDVTHIAEEGIEGYRVVRLFGGEEYEKNKFAQAVQLNRHREMKVIVTNSIGSSLVQLIASLPIAVIIYVATLPHLHVSVGGFSAIIAAMLRLLTPMRRLTKVNTEIQKGIAGANSIFELLDQELEKDVGIHPLDRAQGHIEYKHVTFNYPNAKKEVLRDVSFEIKPGQTVALVGRSGGGKSTLVSLLPRFYDIAAGRGEILLDGNNINDYKLSDLRRQFAFVSQHLTLFNDTIARNIAYGALEHMDQERIIKAAEAAHIMDFIKQLPEGMNTLIGENGLLLSGGQRQRIAIARALLKDAPILILDEATSSLDTESEFHIQEALEGLMKHRTTLVIAHRLSTVERADKIIVVERGKIVECGTHSELLSLDGLYAKFYKMQFREEEL
jgi:ATP-binding cassette, subfamily B, bacterial MsbA